LSAGSTDAPSARPAAMQRSHAAAASNGTLAVGFRHIGLALLPVSLFLMAMSGGYTLSEPAPYEALFLLVLAAALMANAPFPHALWLPFVLICLNILGGVVAIASGQPADEPLRYLAVAIYLNMSAIIVAMAICTAPMRMLPALRWGYTAGAVSAALCGILGYFNIAGLGAVFTLSGRAAGPFADPNVFGPFLVFPAVFLIIDILRGGPVRMFVGIALFTILALAILLSFSRGAWGHFAISAMVAVTLLLITSRQPIYRIRILVTGIAAIAAATVAMIALISVPQIGDLFAERAKIIQPYDVAGGNGRFDTQAQAAKAIIETPLGFGALEFGDQYGLDPHNVYLKVLTSNGWLGGFAYIGYVLATLMVGFQAALSRSPWRFFAIAAVATFFGQMLEGVIIDTDPWRHFHLTAGMIWGCYAAELVARGQKRPNQQA
jgi:O-antigen ligase